MKKKTTTLLFLTGMILIVAGIPVSSDAAIFDPETDELNNPVIVDDFADDLSKWSIDGYNADASIVEEDGETYMHLNKNTGAELKSGNGIPLPADGDRLVVDTAVKGRFDFRPRLQMFDPDGDADAEVEGNSGSTSVDDLYAQAMDSGMSTDDRLITRSGQSAGDFNVYRFVYDNINGNREVSILVRDHGTNSFVPLEWDSDSGSTSGEVKATDAWSASDDQLQVYLRSYEGGASYVDMNSLQYQTNPIPEPSTLVLLGLAGLLLMKRRRL